VADGGGGRDGPDGAVNIVFRKELEAAEPTARGRELVEDYEERFANPFTRPSAATSTT
jgi:acetyl-CoA carboxylase carboxyltransferase component